MKNFVLKAKDRVGLLKTAVDAHTLGVMVAAQLLETCGFEVAVGGPDVARLMDSLTIPSSVEQLKVWLKENKITVLGFSYRLDPDHAVERFDHLVYLLDSDPKFRIGGGESQIKKLVFAGLPLACERITQKHKGRFDVFCGDETPLETLKRMGVPERLIGSEFKQNSAYDDARMAFAGELLDKNIPAQIQSQPVPDYPDAGTPRDHLLKRLEFARHQKAFPLLRAHVGPYLPNQTREEAIKLFLHWLDLLSGTRHLDIVSVGSSQLTQSHFGEDWGDLPNGGGVPVNNEVEFHMIAEAAKPLLVRAYSGTNRVPQVAEILERSLNICWHALSLWWFNQMDGRGPLSVQEGLRQHLQTLSYIAKTGKPFEPNVPHHFSFRGGDDLTYVVSGVLAARVAKRYGIQHLILQNMMNTPKATSGQRDLVKARVMLQLARELEDDRFHVIYQPRAGLDYFSPDLEKAKRQLAAVTALMCDVEPNDVSSPGIIHVVSYSEAVHLADPPIIDESARITRAAYRHYADYRKKSGLLDMVINPDIDEEVAEMKNEVRLIINDMEKKIPALYTPEGLYQVLKLGYFPIPGLWGQREEFPRATNWPVRYMNGGFSVVDEQNKKMSIENRLALIHYESQFEAK